MFLAKNCFSIEKHDYENFLLERGRIKDTSEIKHFYELDKEYILALIVRTNNEPVINKYLQYILSLIDFTLPDIYIEYYLLYAENYV